MFVPLTVAVTCGGVVSSRRSRSWLGVDGGKVSPTVLTERTS